jgi:hypothetical protein
MESTTDVLHRHREARAARNALHLRRFWLALIAVGGTLDLLLFLRLCFRFFGANADAAAVRALYSVTQPFLLPFTEVFTDVSFAGLLFEPAAVIALFVYGSIISGTAYFTRLALETRSQ